MMDSAWLSAVRRYMAVSLFGHALWEVVQLPLFTLWQEAPPRTVAFAALHCLGGDIAIASTVLVAALVLAGRHDWPRGGAASVAALVLTLGGVYTGWSEYSNAIVRQTWTYTSAMPLVPWWGIGVTPLLQWLIIPAIALRAASRWAQKAHP